MAILEVVVEEANGIYQQIKRHTLHPLTSQRKEEYNPDDPAILLIHGFFVNDIHLRGLRDFLISREFNVICEPHCYIRENLNKIESQIFSEIKETYCKTEKQINLIGYSAGGLIARSLAQNSPEFIDKVITLGTPHQGTLAASLAPFITGVKQMLPCSNYIKKLNQAPIPKNVDLYSIYSVHDQAVIPNRNAAIPSNCNNVTNLPIENVGHWGLLSDKVYPLVADILNR